jgi:hypothetical protein
MRIRHYILLLSVAALLGSCYHDVHDFGNEPTPSGEEVGYLTPQLDYEFPEDKGTPVDSLQITIGGANGTDYNHGFSSMEEAASWLKQLSVGEYDVLVTQNMTARHGYTLQNGIVSLFDPASSPDQAWYAMTHVTIRNQEITVAEFELKRLMAYLELGISNTPDGTTIDVTVDHMAKSVDLMTNDYRGRLGQPDSEYMAVPLGKAHASTRNGTRSVRLSTGMQSLLPTSSTFDRTYVDLWVITPTGKELFCLGDTPRMESGFTYIIDLDYRYLKPYMRLEWYRINEWTYGAVIEGAVEVPDEEK